MGFGNDYRDTQLARQVDLARFVEWEDQRTAAFFERLYNDIIQRLRAFDDSGKNLARAAHLRELEKSYRATLKEGYKEFQKFMDGDFFEMVVSEEAFVGTSFNQIGQMPLITNALSPSWLKGIVTGQVVQGGPMHEWWSRQANGTLAQIMDAIRLGLAQGDGIPEIVRRLRGEATGVGQVILDPITGRMRWVQAYDGGVMAYSRRNAEAIIRTATQGIISDARRDVYRANPDVVMGIEQVSALDNRTTDICIMYDGEWWEFGPGGEMIPRGPKGLDYAGGVPRHWNCRSTEVPKTPSWRDLGIPLDEISTGTRRTMDGEVSSNITGTQWLKQKYKTDPQIVYSIFGKKKGELWAQGRLTDADLMTQKGRPLSLKEIIRRSSGADGNHYTRIFQG